MESINLTIDVLLRNLAKSCCCLAVVLLLFQERHSHIVRASNYLIPNLILFSKSQEALRNYFNQFEDNLTTSQYVDQVSAQYNIL